jgi:hypothetical protein
MLVIAALEQPIITNEIAMGQMQNDDTMFVIMDMYNRLKPVFSTAYTLAIILFVCTLGRDTYKFVKNNNNNEKEN